MSVPSGRRPTTSVKVPPRSIQKSQVDPFSGGVSADLLHVSRVAQPPSLGCFDAVGTRRASCGVFSIGSICSPAMPPACSWSSIFVLMMVLSVGRPIGLNIPAGDDFVSWCMAAMAFLGLAHTFSPAR